ncbi:hypothetical protein PoB_000214200, partial [Plakobranchus ocellatus]
MKSKPFGKKKGPKPGLKGKLNKTVDADLKMKSKPFGKKKGPKPGLKGKFNKTVDAE